MQNVEGWTTVGFKDVPIGAEFGFGDYFHSKVNDTEAYCDVSGENHKWDPNCPVVVQAKEVDVVDEDWLAGVSCNPNAPEECESCQ